MTGRVICNTGPLIALASVGRLDLLKEIFTDLCVTPTVLEEVRRGSVGREGLEQAISSGWIRVVEHVQPADPLLDDVLDRRRARRRS